MIFQQNGIEYYSEFCLTNKYPTMNVEHGNQRRHARIPSERKKGAINLQPILMFTPCLGNSVWSKHGFQLNANNFYFSIYFHTFFLWFYPFLFMNLLSLLLCIFHFSFIINHSFDFSFTYMFLVVVICS